MREDLHAVAQWHMNENHAAQLSLNFINKENELVGYIDVDAPGNMSWQIVNLEYKEFFNMILPYLYNGNTDNRISYASIEQDPLRWTRMRIYLAKQNIPIKYSQEINDLQEEKSMSR